ncbi:hypothetical protein [Prolixibacter sp. NT017]|uniref:hypothetical protein n=1 Tax=Prolixibacter sp. NT017 TaxID=2652390 RepID=UPI00126D226E|nr:hypothetical protein [Prolixibacter sp. NT017]GET25765.1 hypothetical protein NT017_20940 [Prolixibacter sp. NT017]
MEDIDRDLTILYDLGNRFRYQIIDSAVTIELLISEILTELISNDKTRDPIQRYLFADKTTFELKIDFFNALNKNKAFEPCLKDTSINKDLIYLIKIRNLMAHSRIDTSDEARILFKEEQIRFYSRTHKGIKEVFIKIRGNTDNHEKLIFSQEVFVPTIEKIKTRLLSLLAYLQSRN